MIKITELEKYFEKSFDKLLNDNDIVMVADDIKGAWGNYRNWELKYCYDNEDKKIVKEYLNTIKTDFYKWVQNCSTDDLFNYELSTYQRHFMLEDNNIYYLNSYL